MTKQKAKSKKQAHKKEKHQENEEVQFPEKVEKIFKYVLRSLSWIVGIAFFMVLLLPEFNSAILDKITRVLYIMGISSLILFLVIEFFAPNIKSLINRIIHE